jgi:penicillin-binding protein 1A
LQIPLRVYTKSGEFIAEFGEQRCVPLTMDKIPPLLVKAVLAAEDDRFFEHPGVDFKSIIRAGVNLVKTREIQQGASTITMQVSRNFFLSREKTFARKLKEILLALKIENELEKDKILELYMNKIFFGHRAYGVGAAAQVYYGKNVNELGLAEFAMLAGIPKAPSANNPLSNPEAALERRDYVLRRMLSLNYITYQDYEMAVNSTVSAQLHHTVVEAEAPYIAEMVRAYMYERYGDDAYTKGYKVTTTIDKKLQEAAQSALRTALHQYDERHGYRGPLGYAKLPSKLTGVAKTAEDILQKYPVQGGLIPSLVLQVKAKQVVAYNRQAGEFEIDWSDLNWARRYVKRDKVSSSPNNAWDILKRGDIIMVRSMGEILPEKQSAKKNVPPKSLSKKGEIVKTASKDKGNKTVSTPEVVEQPPVPKIRWRLASVPKVSGALVSLHPEDGSIIALTGGFDFYQSKFNRAVQADRQPGSTFKPFIYSAAIHHGYSQYSVVNDAPLVIVGENRKVWRPQNYSGKYYGPVSLRNALINSRNLASIHLLRKVGIDRTINHVTLFGFKRERIPRNLTMALGTGAVTPLELTSGFAVFANGGYRIEPYFIQQIEDIEGNIVFSANPARVCRQCPPQVLASKGNNEKVPKLAEPNKNSIIENLKNESSSFIVAHASELQKTNYNITPVSVEARYAPRVIRAQVAETMTSILKGVILEGTGKRARKLNRSDIAGKTGTTNEQRDAWFSGYTPDMVTTAWVGFDQPKSLGHGETGSQAALPMWMEYMAVALQGKPLRDLDPSYHRPASQIADSEETGIARDKKRTLNKQNRRTTTNNAAKDTANTGSSNKKNNVASSRASQNDSRGSAGQAAERPKEKRMIPEQLF